MQDRLLFITNFEVKFGKMPLPTSNERANGASASYAYGDNYKNAVDNKILYSNSEGTCIVDELLCFVINKNDSGMLLDTLEKIVIDFYDAGTIESSKFLLLNVIKASCADDTLIPRVTKRKGENKSKNDVSDIMQLLHSSAYNNMADKPVFIAKDLSLLPPITPQEMDISILMKRLMKMQLDFDDFRNNCVSKDDLQVELRRISNVSTLNLDSPPSDHSAQGKSAVKPANEKTKTAYCVQQTGVAHSGTNKNSYAQIAQRINSDHNASDEPFKTVEKRRSKKKGRVILGSCKDDSSSNISIVQPKTEIFATRFGQDVTTENIRNLITHKTSCSPIGVRKLNTKYDTYSSFVITCNAADKETLLSDSVWPSGALIRPFVQRRTSLASATLNVDTPSVNAS